MTVKVSDPIKIDLPNKQNAVNATDLIKYNNKFYLAYRTSKNHFASKKTQLIIAESYDSITWTLNKIIDLGSDIKEPRFIKTNDSLLLYFFKGGTTAYKFQPSKIYYTELKSNLWSFPKELDFSGFINWRIREHNKHYYMSIYNGKNIYGNHAPKILILKSDNAKNWKDYLHIPINIQGATEPEFVFHNNMIYGTVRLEGYGSMLFNYDGKFKFKRLKIKFDSNLMFKHNNKIYMISRRNIDGDAEKTNSRAYNLIRYSLTKKTTALYEFKKDLSIKHITDIESKGDTAFPAITMIEKNKFLLVNYSSDISKPNLPWIISQLSKTHMYKYIIEL